ncbi:MAG TPA: L,D-transpeptidase [Phycisphaerae bacterium]|nr:L,D-transpeptidase [Phycisphaerae bacterium]
MFKRMRLISCLAIAAGCMLSTTSTARAQRMLREPQDQPTAEADPGDESDLSDRPEGATANADQPSGQAPTPADSSEDQIDAGQPAEPPASQPESGIVPLLGRAKSNRTNTAAAPTVSDSVALQIALDRAGFSPGLIDGNVGRKTQVAIAAFQKSAGLPATGKLDDATRRALAVGSSANGGLVRRFTLTESDIAQVGPWPKDWIEKSQVKRLGYKSVAAMAAERGHCSLAMLARLNRGVDLDSLAAGDVVWLPAVEMPASTPKAACIEIDLAQKLLRVLDKSGKVVALFHCSIAKDKAKLPKRSCKVAVIAPNPIYIFDPKMWPEVKNLHRKLVIPPGPRNPVGLCWLGLSLDGYGIHGTPEPEMIGKTGSHGCIRLANWDAQRLGKMVRVGMEVRFTNGPTSVARR